jgi:hypothetical protein
MEDGRGKQKQLQVTGYRVQGTIKIEDGRGKREAKTAASERVQVAGFRPQGRNCKRLEIVKSWERQPLLPVTESHLTKPMKIETHVIKLIE